jgi:hypothetical protein
VLSQQALKLNYCDPILRAGEAERTLIPVRAAAAAAITNLLRSSCWPGDWSPLLSAAVEMCGAADEEAACRSFALLEVRGCGCNTVRIGCCQRLGLDWVWRYHVLAKERTKSAD